MHYESRLFAKQGKYTLLSKVAPQIIPRNYFISDIDVKEIQTLYKCTAGSTSIVWKEELGNSWAYSCDFSNSDLTKVTVSIESCSTKCRLTLGCTHYAWSNGVCYLKKNTAVTKANAFNNNNQNTICGILTPGKLPVILQIIK